MVPAPPLRPCQRRAGRAKPAAGEASRRCGWTALIPEDTAAALLPALMEYRSSLVRAIGHEDEARAIDEEQAAGIDVVAAKWGRGPGNGYRLYCVTDLIQACRVAVSEHRDVVIAFG